MYRVLAAIANTSLFLKLFLAFVLVLAVPISISYYFSQRSTTDVVINRVLQETQDSLEVVGNQVEDVLQRMIYVALYMNNDENLRSLLQGTVRQRGGGAQDDRLLGWTRQTTIDKMFDNLSFNVMRSKCYFTLVALTGGTYTNWPTRDTDLSAYTAGYTSTRSTGPGMYVQWIGIERNRISAEAARSPFVITLTKTIIGRQGNTPYALLVVSVPESEVRALMVRGRSARSWYMIDRDLRVISGSDPAVLGTRILGSSERSLLAGPEGHFVTDLPGRGRSLVAYRTMRNNEWKLLTVEPSASITPELGRIRLQLLLANAVAALAFMAVAALIARSITRPIHALSLNMRNFESEISRSGGGQVRRADEIGQLQRSYEAMRRQIRRLVREVAAKEKKKREAELEALQLQVSPHFLFNTLSSVRWAIRNRNNGKASQMIFALGNLLRMSLLKTNAFITVEQEMQNLSHYVDIIKLRSDAAFTVRFRVDGEVGRELIPRLLLQPIVENAVIHGMEGTRDGRIDVSARRQGRHLLFTVTDNGKGMAVADADGRGIARTAKLSGIGIRNVDERIKLIYGPRFGLHSGSRPGKGTEVTVMIPSMPGRRTV